MKGVECLGGSFFMWVRMLLLSGVRRFETTTKNKSKKKNGDWDIVGVLSFSSRSKKEVHIMHWPLFVDTRIKEKG